MNHSNRDIDLYPRLARVWFAPLALMAACGGSASGAGNGSGGSAQAGAASAGMGSNAAGSSNGGSGNAGSGSAGSGGTIAGGANAGAAAGGSAGAGTAAGGSAGSGAIKHCGGIAGIACAKEEYCKFPESAQCGAGDQSGECTHIPGGGCTLEYSPVCGCDGKTYGNECAAATAGASIARAGACDTAPPGSCSVTPDGASYPDGSTEIPKGDGCNVCTCTKGVLSCTARPCKAPTSCGARAGDTCAATEYCAYQSSGLCGAADQQAFCEPRPSLCSELYQPVCGCDRKTYPNTCVAAHAGTGVLQAGPCPL